MTVNNESVKKKEYPEAATELDQVMSPDQGTVLYMDCWLRNCKYATLRILQAQSGCSDVF